MQVVVAARGVPADQAGLVERGQPVAGDPAVPRRGPEIARDHVGLVRRAPARSVRAGLARRAPAQSGASVQVGGEAEEDQPVQVVDGSGRATRVDAGDGGVPGGVGTVVQGRHEARSYEIAVIIFKIWTNRPRCVAMKTVSIAVARGRGHP
ncbi:hypothetical protein ACFQQB_55500 [Nonomuraea rubra]|uniref:hypothetical protein n=1 Tax=Nonomuraea rubra TaxID=46180 RepID=UPI00361D0A8D